jgi:hypothetical protein
VYCHRGGRSPVGYCAGATALGISSVQIVRGTADLPEPGATTVVRSLSELDPLF